MTISGVVMVHDLHIWSITAGKVALAAHLLVAFADLENPELKAEKGCFSEDGMYNQLLKEAQSLLADKYHIHHSTIQIEISEEAP